MILTSPEIQKQVLAGRITIEPFASEHLNPNSYNYHLGGELIIFSPGPIDRYNPRYRRLAIPDSGYILRPGKLYLGQTMEKLGSSEYVTSLIGRSTMGRLGLWLQITADLGNIGNCHHWTLEMNVVQPLRIYAGMPIGQITFWKCHGAITERYTGRYARDFRPTVSKLT